MGTTPEIWLEEFVRAMESMGSGMHILEILDVIFSGFSSLVSIAVYVLSALALFIIAKRRNLEKPWAAWIPCGNAWILGCLSDQFRAAAYGETSKRGKDLLKHGIIYAVSVVIFLHCWLFCVLGIVLSILSGMGEIDAVVAVGLLICAMILLIAATVVFAIFAVRYYIRFYKAMYDLYLSCYPSLAILFLMLSIFVPGGQPACLMICRNRDDGMPQIVPMPLLEAEEPQEN